MQFTCTSSHANETVYLHNKLMTLIYGVVGGPTAYSPMPVFIFPSLWATFRVHITLQMNRKTERHTQNILPLLHNERRTHFCLDFLYFFLRKGRVAEGIQGRDKPDVLKNNCSWHLQVPITCCQQISSLKLFLSLEPEKTTTTVCWNKVKQNSEGWNKLWCDGLPVTCC